MGKYRLDMISNIDYCIYRNLNMKHNRLNWYNYDNNQDRFHKLNLTLDNEE